MSQYERTGGSGIVQTSLLANGLWSAAGLADFDLPVNRVALVEDALTDVQVTEKVNTAMTFSLELGYSAAAIAAMRQASAFQVFP